MKLFRRFVWAILLLGVVHTLAIVFRGNGFDPHPWYLALPYAVRRPISDAGVQVANISVFFAYLYALPVYGAAVFLASLLAWLGRRGTRPDSS